MKNTCLKIIASSLCYLDVVTAIYMLNVYSKILFNIWNQNDLISPAQAKIQAKSGFKPDGSCIN